MAAVDKNQRWQHYRSTKTILIDGMAGVLGMIMYGWAGKIQFNQKALLLMAVQQQQCSFMAAVTKNQRWQ